MENVLEVKGLSKQYTKVLAADKVSFEIGKGEIVKVPFAEFCRLMEG